MIDQVQEIYQTITQPGTTWRANRATTRVAPKGLHKNNFPFWRERRAADARRRDAGDACAHRPGAGMRVARASPSTLRASSKMGSYFLRRP